MKIEQTIVFCKVMLVLILAILTSPIWIPVVLVFLFWSLIIELTQEYRCMRCGKWIPNKDRKPGEIVHWCSKECYYDK